MGYVVVIYDAGGWHAVWCKLGASWDEALAAHGAAIGALDVIDHPHSQRTKILLMGADYESEPLAAEATR